MCDNVPKQMAAVSISSSSMDCNQTMINFGAVHSCGIVQYKEVQCAGSDGIYTNLNSSSNTINARATEIVIDAADL